MVLSLFFTRNISLQTWIEKGLFEREKLIYEKHLVENTFSTVNWFTYGIEDYTLAKKLILEKRLNKNINVYPMPKIFNSKFGRLLYVFLLPIIYFSVLNKSDILKSNQMDGSFSAVIAKLICRKKLIIRTGFTLSLFAKRMKKNRLIMFIVYLIEKISYGYADQIIISSKFDKEYISRRYNLKESKISVLYNYIDTSKFKNNNTERNVNRIITVGRLVEQKNLFNLIKAISNTNYVLDIYGDGNLKNELVQYSKQINANVNFLGIVSNDKLTNIFNEYSFFVLASEYEGMPKVLLESMACGCLCLGTNVMGINEIIKDQENGYLSKSTKSEDLTNMFMNMKVTERMLSNASLYIQKNFTIERFFEKEKMIYEK